MYVFVQDNMGQHSFVVYLQTDSTTRPLVSQLGEHGLWEEERIAHASVWIKTLIITQRIKLITGGLDARWQQQGISSFWMYSFSVHGSWWLTANTHCDALKTPEPRAAADSSKASCFYKHSCLAAEEAIWVCTRPLNRKKMYLLLCIVSQVNKTE